MKRYLVFGSSIYYPAGGWEDFLEAYDTLEQAQARKDAYEAESQYQWSHVVDTETMETL